MIISKQAYVETVLQVKNKNIIKTIHLNSDVQNVNVVDVISLTGKIKIKTRFVTYSDYYEVKCDFTYFGFTLLICIHTYRNIICKN